MTWMFINLLASFFLYIQRCRSFLICYIIFFVSIKFYFIVDDICIQNKIAIIRVYEYKCSELCYELRLLLLILIKDVMKTDFCLQSFVTRYLSLCFHFRNGNDGSECNCCVGKFVVYCCAHFFVQLRGGGCCVKK